ncbi:class I adenylate-forming enzyme family protein [Pigmentiphaga litoralis]|uniref:Acyl-CoA synthetase (AMP-forming)/AMP-acid ligase II n=1 Tax=Pigmentiphaga litoralis TaxID=516702 RepID=A0A7Y9LP30_9BURK|nr:class I adenylate-forming enzyme family protein [Pigmentiphaga litoralis]NYE22909.1 acyl-CoA synthetase (AMP-forming)/AMP-acid ligase II [Pigmentiphaga litoralis]NYE83476.1 acyl-CoA synthetase (AMP-forming)/AMP-acid ligase II [Pigmentiphaga litoralis]
MSSALTFHCIHDVLSHQAHERPEAIALYEEGGGALTYGGLWQRAQAAATWLQAQGVGAGDRVMVVGENCSDMVVALFACSVIHAWPVSVNARLSPRELGAIREHASPVLVLYTTQVSAAAAGHADADEARAADPAVWSAGCRVGVTGAEAAAHGQAVAAPPAGTSQAGGDIPADRVACIIYTSGTTGAPKGVMVPHEGLIHFGRISSASRRLTPDDIGYAALPFSHIFGIATVLMASVYAGASLVVRSRFDAADVFAALVHPGISILQGVPTMFSRLMAVAPPGKIEAPKLRYLYTGGAALDPTLKVRVQDAFGLPMHHGYGITEYAGSMCITDIDAPRDDASAGHPVEGVTVHIGPLDEPSRKGGVTGDIFIHGPGVMLGYYRNPGLTAATLHPGGWLDTGDVGYIDDSGALFIAGRTKDLIIRSGFNVYPLEVESVINAFPGVRASAVIGVEEADRNEEVVAFIEALPGAEVDLPSLRDFLRDRLAPYKRPARLIAIDTLPTTVSGKILKQPLRERVPARTPA